MPLPLTDPATVFAWCAAPFAGTGVAALFALDRQLGDIVRTTAQPLVGQMRLTWWHEALSALDRAPPPAQPLLAALAGQVVAAGVGGAALAAMIDGWEVLLDPDAPDDAALAGYAAARGRALFGAAARLLGAAANVAEAGAGWALADLAANVASATLAARAATLGERELRHALGQRWKGARPLGALARDAALALEGRGVPGGPRRAAAVLRFRTFGR